MTQLPSEGYRGDVPDVGRFLAEVTIRHEEIWAELWTTPQACAWSVEPWRWPIVADLVKWSVRSDDPAAPAALANSVRQLRDDCGLSTAGLIQNGWAISTDELAEKREDHATILTPRSSSRDRMKVVGGSGKR